MQVDLEKGTHNEMTTFTALAIDPGGTTGWAYYRAEKMVDPFDDLKAYPGDIAIADMSEIPQEAVEWYDEEWTCGQLGPEDHADELLTLLELNHTAEYQVIVERFVPRPGKIGAKLEPAPRYITIAEMFCKERGLEMHLQNVGQVKPFVKDANIKKLGLWTPSQRHAMDGMRHLLFWLCNGPYKRTDLLRKGWK